MTPKQKHKFAIFGAGWWAANFQIPAWFELESVEPVAICDPDENKANLVAKKYGIPSVYSDPQVVFAKEKVDFVDIIASVPAHVPLVYLAAQYGIPVICQKPMANSYEDCLKMVELCRNKGIPFIIHENMRWQSPIRELKRLLDEKQIGQVFRARLQYNYNAPGIYEFQPYLKDLDQLILPDLGSHMLDVARFLFGEATSLYCQIHRTREDIRGEDVASVILQMGNVTCNCEMSFATYTEWGEQAGFQAIVEGTKGSVKLLPGFWIRLINERGTYAWRCSPKQYSWSGPGEEAAWCASIVDCHQNILKSIKTGEKAETDAEDNLKTMSLLFHSYESASYNQVIVLERDLAERKEV